MTRDEALKSLVERAEEAILHSTDVDVSSICNSNREAFADLRALSLICCDTVEYITRISQYEIQYSCQLRTSFSKLTIIQITDCSAMKYLFCKSVAKCLLQLQELKIYNCGGMEVIVMNEGTNDEYINFCKLKKLKLENLPSLRSFYMEKKEMHWGSMDHSVVSCAQFQPLFGGMVWLPFIKLYIYRLLF